MAGKVRRVASVVVAVVVVRLVVVVVVLIVDGQVHTVFARENKSSEQNYCDYYYRKFLFSR